MVTFLELGSLGRLGNQLFQYGALKSLALYKGTPAILPPLRNKIWHGQDCQLKEFNIECDYATPMDIKKIAYVYNEPDYMKFDTKFFDLPNNINLHGFFQSILYFRHCEEQIKKELTPKNIHLDKAKKMIDSLKRKYPGYEIVSLHLRRGDNTDGSNPSRELNEMYGKTKGLDPKSFYGKYMNTALKEFEGKTVKYLVFSGGSRDPSIDNKNDIEWCKQNFEGNDFIFSKGNTPIDDFSLIASCDHNILSHISSFGWWAAYVNSNPNKIVVAPEHYHPDLPEYTYREGFYPAEWRKV
tara:strand:- start:7135 stop:8025 length:891 start_codon:yes stop_codon:yes gene_type:complete